jgi:hypothetical protein
MFQECFKSSLEGVTSLYALGDAFYLTMNGPSHFGSSLPRDSVRVVRTSTRSPLLNSLRTTAVGTLKQGYPLLQYEDTVPTRLSLVAW